MKNYGDLKQYSVFEINGILDSLREQYDLVRLVDTEECRIFDVQADGTIDYGQNCFAIWGRSNRCADCSSFRACQTHHCMDKTEHLGKEKEKIHSIPIYLEMASGEQELCVIECVRDGGPEDASYEEQVPAEYVSNYDVLTKLYSQEKLFREIRLRLVNQPNDDYMLVMWNVRNFSVINHMFGIEGGNRLLTGIADILRRECTGGEVYGRYRDDRFIILTRKSDFDEARMISAAEEAGGLVGSPIFRAHIKLGACMIPSSHMPVSTMISHADIAVDSIRDSRDEMLAWYEPGMLALKMKNLHIISDFEDALKNDEFQIYLQPQVRDDGTICGGEALVRWIRPDGSVMLPGEFLGVLHQSELLSNLDAHVWEKAVRQLRLWKGTEFEPLYISINVDPTDFYYLDVPKVLIALCQKYGVDPVKLRVEITETAIVQDVEQQNYMVDRLHEAGFIVEIDDFGKGFSSLSMLKDIAADGLKIDMGFVQTDTNQDRRDIILKSVIDMADSLKMGVITEGVETLDQANRLIHLGCRNFQGFYYSRPIPVTAFEMVARETM